MIPLYALSVEGSDVKVRHTDAQGDYTFLLTNGSWVVQADPYYASWWPDPHKYAMYRAEYFNNQFFYADATPLVIAPGVTHSNVDFVLERYADIKGRVVNAANQQPLTGIPVGASCEEGGIGSGLLRTTTDTNGQYTLHVNVGQWKVYANPEGLGFAGQYWSNKTSSAGADLVEVEALGTTHSNINFSLQAVLYGRISGFVYRPDGSPAEWASVSASGNNFYPPSAYANSSGYWEMATLQADTYMISVYQYPYPTQYYCAQYNQDYAHRITLTAGADVRNITFQFLEPARIVGTMRDRAGAAIRSAYVGFSSVDGGWGGANTTEDGTYVIEGLPPGHYRVYASPAGYLQSWYSNRTSDATADRVALEAGQTVSNIDFTLDGGGTIAGVVSNTSGGVAGNIQVLVTPAGADRNGPGLVEHYSDYSGMYDGLFRVEGIRRSSCVMQVIGSSYGHKAGAFYDGKLAYEAADIIDLAATDLVENITLYSYNEAKITGKVTASGGGAGLYEVTVYVLTTNGYEVGHGETDESGRYTCQALAPGTYVVLAAPMFLNEEYGGTYAPRYYGGVTSLGSATRITLTEGMTKSSADIALVTTSGGISGRVTRAVDGAPLKDHSVYVWTTGAPMVRVGSAGTDASGHYTVRGLPAGTYRTQTWPNNFAALQFYSGKTNYSSADNITIGSSIVGGIDFALDEVAPTPYAPAMRQPLPPVWLSPVVFEWTAIEGARFYELRVDDLTAGTTGVLQQAEISDTQHVSVVSFIRNHQYRAQVRAGNSAGYGEFGPPMPFIYLAPPLFALTVITNGPGRVLLDPPGGSYEPGTVVTLAAVEQDGSTFDHWSGVDSAANQPSTVVTVMVARAVTAFFVANRSPRTPVSVAPTNGAVVDLAGAVLEAAPFEDPDLGDTFGASHFLVYETGGVPLAQSDTNTPPQTGFALASTALQGNASYYWRARYADGHGLWSDWSAPASFSTSNRPPVTPRCLLPAGGDKASISPLLQATVFSDLDSMDTHAASRWQLAGAGGSFEPPVYSTDTVAAAYHLVPPGTLAYTSHFWRVCYKDSHEGWSGWSDPAAFDAVLTVDGISASTGGTFAITWPTLAGYLYTLYSTTNLDGGSWTPVTNHVDVPGTGGLMTCERFADGTSTYYRVTVELAAP
jgi:hypothetical protein